MVSSGLPAGVFAPSVGRSPLATISGETVDAAGRALVNERVELIRTSEVLRTVQSGNRGEWSFTNVEPGDYIVRTTINGQVAGARVSVVAGQMVARALIVAPSAAAPSNAILIPFFAWIGSLGAIGGTLVVAGIIAAIAGTTIALTGS